MQWFWHQDCRFFGINDAVILASRLHWAKVVFYFTFIPWKTQTTYQWSCSFQLFIHQHLFNRWHKLISIKHHSIKQNQAVFAAAVLCILAFCLIGIVLSCGQVLYVFRFHCYSFCWFLRFYPIWRWSCSWPYCNCFHHFVPVAGYMYFLKRFVMYRLSRNRMYH